MIWRQGRGWQGRSSAACASADASARLSQELAAQHSAGSSYDGPARVDKTLVGGVACVLGCVDVNCIITIGIARQKKTTILMACLLSSAQSQRYFPSSVDFFLHRDINRPAVRPLDSRPFLTCNL
eukprot:scaffold119436_cov18-Tisochrysis_lutea.AAC.2